MCQPGGDKRAFIERMIAEGAFVEEEDWPVELETPDAMRVVDRFWEFHNRRAAWDVAIGWQDFAAYQAVTGRALSGWLIEQICRLDNLYLEACGELKKELARRG